MIDHHKVAASGGSVARNARIEIEQKTVRAKRGDSPKGRAGCERGDPYAGKLHVRFDEGYPPKNGEARFEGSRRPSGRTR